MAGKKDAGFGLLAGGLLGAGIILALSKPTEAQQCPPGYHWDVTLNACVQDASTGTILTVKAVTSSGSDLPGMFVQVYDQTGTTVIAEGSSPLDVQVTPGTVVAVTMQNFENNVFSYWQDSFDIDRTLRIVNVAQSTVLAGVYSTTGIPIPPPTTGDNRTLTVASIDQNGLPVTGMGVDVTLGTAIISEGFTPHLAQVRLGTTVGVAVSSSYIDNNVDSPTYGTVWTFQQWTDGVATNVRTVTVNGNTTVTAIYNVTQGGTTVPPPNSTPYTVNAYLQGTNTPINVPARITRVSTGTITDVQTPHTWNAIQGEQYIVEIMNTTEFQFVQWGNGSGQPIRAATIGTTPVTMTAYFTRLNTVPGSIALTVAATNIAGQPLGNFFTTLYSGGLITETGFTPAIFNVVPGQNYDITVADFEASVFQRWSDGVLTRRRTVNISVPTTFTAIYAS